MPRRESVDEALARLRAIRDPFTDETHQVLLDALAGGASVVVQRACSIIRDAGLEGFEAALMSAFERLLEGGAQADAGCGGKVAIVEALARLRLPADDVFLKATHHVQHEYLEDTGARLRAQGIVALAESGYGGMLEEAVDLLFDRELGARIGAVQALLADGSRAALLLLRYKALQGDQPELQHEVLAGLLERQPSSLEFVASFLKRGPVAPAAMALASSRRPKAFAFLRDAVEGSLEEDTRALLMAMAMLRSDESLDYLFAQLNGRDIGLAVLAYDALQIYERDEEIKSRLDKAVKASKYRRLLLGPRRGWSE